LTTAKSSLILPLIQCVYIFNHLIVLLNLFLQHTISATNIIGLNEVKKTQAYKQLRNVLKKSKILQEKQLDG